MKQNLIAPLFMTAVLLFGASETPGHFEQKTPKRKQERKTEMNQETPFIIVRNYGNGKRNANYTKFLFEMQKKYPGLINEIWFGGCSSLDGLDVVEKLAPLSLPFREECRQLGIRFSLQIGQTLNHNADGKKRPHFSDEAWVVDAAGEIRYGLFCPLSPEAQEYARKSAEIVLRVLQPDSFWPDDDLRLFYKSYHQICCCHRCLDRFNQRFHHHFSREELKKILETSNSAEAAVIRREWTLSNAENLGEFASVYRAAVEREAPECMIGLQLPYAKWIYDGPDPIPRLKGLAGKDGKKVGIRPGAGHYTDGAPREMLAKSLDIQAESARCRRSGLVSQVCYEAENWPHIGSEKNPYSQMTECALALASGADSLALYWGTDINRESDELNRFYFEALHEYKPFLMAIRDAFSGCLPSGISRFRGAKLYEQPEWLDQSHPSENIMMENGMPVTRPETMPEAFWLDERSLRELAAEDLPKLFTKTVLMNVSMFEQLSKNFPELKFTKKVELKEASTSRDAVNSNPNEMYECFEGDKFSMFLSKVIHPRDPSVKPFSTVTGGGPGCGTCVIPTEFGGSVVLKQNMRWPNFFNGYRRKAILDALDHASGGLCVRLITNGFAINVLGQKNAEGKTAGGFLLNLGCGRTMPLEFAIRNPASENYALHLPGKEPIPLTPVSRKNNELIFRLPALEAWQPAAILPDKTKMRIVAFGDSITEGVIGVTPEQNWLKLLGAKLGSGYKLFNAGVGGNSAREAMARLEKDVLSRHPNAILIEFGGNNNDPVKPERRVNDEEFMRHLNHFKESLPPSCKVMMITFPPIIDERHALRDKVPGGKVNIRLESQRQIVRDFAAANGWLLLDLYALMYDRRHELVLPDGVHLNSAGQVFFAEEVYKLMKRAGWIGQ